MFGWQHPCGATAAKSGLFFKIPCNDLFCFKKSNRQEREIGIIINGQYIGPEIFQVPAVHRISHGLVVKYFQSQFVKRVRVAVPEDPGTQC